MGFPLVLLVFSEIALEGFLAPGTVDGVCDWREGGYGFIFPGVFKELMSKCALAMGVSTSYTLYSWAMTDQRQSSMTSHAMPRDANPTRVQLLEFFEKSCGQLFGNITVHFVALRPWIFGSINIESCSTAKVIRIVLALDL